MTIALGYEIARIPTIHPRPHDIPLDFFVSESGILARAPVMFVASNPSRRRRWSAPFLRERLMPQQRPSQVLPRLATNRVHRADSSRPARFGRVINRSCARGTPGEGEGRNGHDTDVHVLTIVRDPC